MALPPCSRDLIYRELLVDHLTESIHVAGRHYSSKDKLWNALADAFNDVSMNTTEKLTSSADNRLSFFAQNKGRYTNTYASPNDRKFSFKVKSLELTCNQMPSGLLYDLSKYNIHFVVNGL